MINWAGLWVFRICLSFLCCNNKLVDFSLTNCVFTSMFSKYQFDLSVKIPAFSDFRHNSESGFSVLNALNGILFDDTLMTPWFLEIHIDQWKNVAFIWVYVQSNSTCFPFHSQSHLATIHDPVREQINVINIVEVLEDRCHSPLKSSKPSGQESMKNVTHNRRK